MNQVDRVKTLLRERALAYDASLDVSDGSEFYKTVIAPVIAAISPDPVDTDALAFLRARIRQEFPSVPTNDADGIVGLMAKPLAMALEPFKAELQHVKTGQSVRNSASMTTAQASDLAANWLVRLKAGGRSQTSVRVYYASPRTVNVQRTSIFSTTSGLNFLPLQPQVIRIEAMLVQKEGSEYFIDIPVIAEREGKEYDVEPGAIRQSASFSSATRITNRLRARGGDGGESAEKLLQRVEVSATERSLTTGRGIVARLNDEFGGLIRDMVAVGAGDPEMKRDILTGRGGGAVIASGICFVVGEYCLLASQFENRGLDGLRAPVAGDEIELNYWSFLYNTPQATRNETFEILDVLLDTRDAAPAFPAVMLFRMSGAPTVPFPATATIPGTHPGVFAAVKSRGTLEISGIPGGILEPNTPRGTLLVEDGEVHVFGHQDVWVRPAATAQGTATMQVFPETGVKEGRSLATGAGSIYVTFDVVCRFTPVSGSVTVGSTLAVEGNPVGTVVDVDGTSLTLVATNPLGDLPVAGGAFTTSGGAAGVFLSVESDDLRGTEIEQKPYEDGYVLEVLTGADKGTYRVLSCLFGRFLVLDKEMSQSLSGGSFRLSRSASVDLFRPVMQILPFAGQTATGLRTAVGSATVRVPENIQNAGGRAGDTLEILSGPDKGAYTIVDFDVVAGGAAAILSGTMSATNSGLPYRVYRPSQGVQTPLVRVVPGGARLLDSTGKDAGAAVPYALPLSARPTNGFTGALTHGQGVCGFVLPDPGPSWSPTGDRSLAGGCYTTGCDTNVGGFVVIISITDTGAMYLDADMPSAAEDYFTDLRQWLLDVIDVLGMGSAAESLVTGLTPILLGPPPGSATLVKQYEFSLPEELWDARHNTFVALPDIDWEAEAARAGTFATALSRFFAGLIEGGFVPSVAASAVPGDTLTLFSGGNAGSYLIEKVTTLRVACSASVVGDVYNEAQTYPVTLITIRDEFPVSPLADLAAFFAEGVPALSVPAAPSLPYLVYDMSGALVQPWAMVNNIFQFLLQWANALGFDIPTGFDLDQEAALRALWQNVFVEYSTGHPTSPQALRLRFVEPTSVTVYSPRAETTETALVSVGGTSPELQGEPHGLTLPDGTLTGKAYAVYVRTAIGRAVLRGTLPASVGTAGNGSALATALTAMLADELADQGLRDFTLEMDEAAGALSLRLSGEPQYRGADVYLEVDVQDPAGAFAVLGFSDENQARGTSTLDLEATFPLSRKATTKFHGTSGPSVLEFCPQPGLEWVLYPPTAPGQSPAPDEMPRDLAPGTPVPGSDYATFWLNRLFEPSLLARPLAPGDVIRVHEQKSLLDLIVPEGPAFQVRDRVVGVILRAGSPVVRLPAMASPDFTFTAPQGDEENAVAVGDLVYIEEGDSVGGYRVVDRDHQSLTLDRPVTETTPRIVACGNTGVIDLAEPSALRVPGGWVGDTSLAVGNFLTIWAAQHPDTNGTYEITAVVVDGATYLLTLDTDVFPAAEADVHWAVTAPLEAPLTPSESSQLDGRTELGAVRPIRIYAGTPSDCVVTLPQLGAEQVNIIHVELPAAGLRASTRPPYSFVRRGAYHISSTAMRAQGRDRGLYWFDVPAISLGHTDAHNIPLDARTDPVFGTYDADGYWFDVKDENLVFSSREDTRIVFSGSFLPDTEEDLLGNRRTITGRSVALTHDYAPIVDRVQSVLSSTSDRNTCADSLARHFCPSYVYLDIAVAGGPDASVLASRLFRRIDAMDALDPLDVSILERDLGGVGSYDHPIFVQVVTHDLSRRLVESRSSNRIDDETLDANATTRTTYFIPGPDRSSTPEAQTPVGERIFIQRGAGRVL